MPSYNESIIQELELFSTPTTPSEPTAPTSQASPTMPQSPAWPNPTSSSSSSNDPFTRIQELFEEITFLYRQIHSPPSAETQAHRQNFISRFQSNLRAHRAEAQREDARQRQEGSLPSSSTTLSVGEPLRKERKALEDMEVDYASFQARRRDLCKGGVSVEWETDWERQEEEWQVKLREARREVEDFGKGS